MTTGRVLEDSTERPLAGVPVSDGHGVTTTADDGTWSLEVHDDAASVGTATDHQSLARSM